MDQAMANLPDGSLLNTHLSALGRAITEALLLNSVQQHEKAERLAAQLEAEAVERKLALDALMNAEKLASLGRMAAAIAHEINNPLEAITNILFLIRTMEGLPAEAEKFLEMAEGELGRVAHITRQTLGFYRENSDAVSFPVASLLDSVLDLLKARVNSKHVIIDRRYNERLKITGKYGELRQVFSNLIVNSLDAIESGGRITLRASLSKSGKCPCLRITVADNGQGIPPAVRSQIFDPFFTTKGPVGNGLGLWVSKQIVDKHSGAIRVRSRTSGPQRGTTFCITLPVDEAVVASSASAPAHAA